MERTIAKQVLVDATVNQVWQAWTTVEGIQTFFARRAHVELRPGGRYEIIFFPKEEPGRRGAEGMHVLSLLPPRMLSFEWNAPPDYPEVRKHRTWVVVELAAAGPNQTQVSLTHLGWQDGEQWDQVFAYFMRAWDVVLGRLQHRFEHGPVDWAKPFTPEAYGNQ